MKLVFSALQRSAGLIDIGRVLAALPKLGDEISQNLLAFDQQGLRRGPKGLDKFKKLILELIGIREYRIECIDWRKTVVDLLQQIEKPRQIWESIFVLLATQEVDQRPRLVVAKLPDSLIACDRIGPVGCR